MLMWVASPEDKIADLAALGRIARGDREALAELYDRNARLVLSLALRILRNRADAEDVVQEVVRGFSQAALLHQRVPEQSEVENELP